MGLQRKREVRDDERDLFESHLHHADSLWDPCSITSIGRVTIPRTRG